MSTQPKIFWSVVIVASLVCSANQTWGQCTSGRSSSGMRGSPAVSGSLASTTSLPSYTRGGLNMPLSYAQQRQLQFVQQQFAAARQRAYRQQAQRYQDQQALLSVRQERATRTRQQRADRIARAKAKREALRSNSSESSGQQVLVSTISET